MIRGVIGLGTIPRPCRRGRQMSHSREQCFQRITLKATLEPDQELQCPLPPSLGLISITRLTLLLFTICPDFLAFCPKALWPGNQRLHQVLPEAWRIWVWGPLFPLFQAKSHMQALNSSPSSLKLLKGHTMPLTSAPHWLLVYWTGLVLNGAKSKWNHRNQPSINKTEATAGLTEPSPILTSVC